MNTKKILLVTSDKELSGIVKISALTLTKLNCQVEIRESFEFEDTINLSKEENLDMIIIDADNKELNILKLIEEIRSYEESSSKKIMTVFSDEIDRDEFFKAGCDSIMTKEEFKRVINNILVM
ncbi:MAG TPA: hypothetical protein PK294_03285 [Ignavibacteria bacterium]|nr:hypothetical protein [Ignavibacteria bacterium]HRA99441.1 hypothetical protein [Ignavibacteria bacterium]